MDPARAGGQDADPRPGRTVKVSGDEKKRRTGVAHGRARPVSQRCLEGQGRRAQAVLRGTLRVPHRSLARNAAGRAEARGGGFVRLAVALLRACEGPATSPSR
jgi:hypothetical protein